jgi:hypothetical protein
MSDSESESENKYKSKFNIGEFVKISRELSVKHNTTDTYENIGVVVKKTLKPKWERKRYWFIGGDYRYCISVPEYGGDYIEANEADMDTISLPIEYKLSCIGKFRNWWFNFHNHVYHELLIEALN